MRLSVGLAHEQSLRAHAALQRRLLLTAAQDQRHFPRTGAADSPGHPVGLIPATSEDGFKPLARTTVTELGAAALERLAQGDVAGVFGPAYDQGEANQAVRLAGSLLVAVGDLSPRGGAWGRGRLAARTVSLSDTVPGDVTRAVIAAVAQAAQVAALSFGLHLCLADAAFTDQCPGLPGGPPWADLPPVAGPVDLLIDVTAVDLVPRPHLVVDAEVLAGGVPVGVVRGVTVAVAERPGVSVGPQAGGFPSRWLGRRGAYGEPAILSEFHLAHACRGDQGTALGPEFARYTGRKATRPPDRGLLLVDRVMELDAQRGQLNRGTIRTEYDSPADSWYYQDTANASMPNCVYMETSLQSSLVLGYHMGTTLAMPDATVSLRNLGGTATVLREVDLRDKTITEHASLLSTSLVPGASLQGFGYTQSADGEPYYRGETLFGYFSDAAMANQTGLDAGQYRPTWLEAQPAPPRTRVIDVAGRRAAPAARLASRRHLALLDEIGVVDGGGQFGLGYLWSTRAIDPADWFFARHFHYDPVVPGSLGVEAVLHAMQEWLLDGGHADGLRDPGFVLPAGLPFTWKYRGQLVPADGQFTLEVHVKSVERRPGRVRAVAEASLWKPGLRIYHLTGAAVELREEGAPPW
jgi:3-hydroxymyristoyl/3-hydroxydecanoyl-(acyl carrier protein) dehydratase